MVNVFCFVFVYLFSPILFVVVMNVNVSSFSISLFVRYVFTLACICMFNRVSSCITCVLASFITIIIAPITVL